MIVTGQTRLAGVMGWPVTHSRSPQLHGYWLRENNIDGAYVPLAVAPENLEQALRALPALGFRGVNVTIPHKEHALQLVDEATPLARQIGAVNTVVVQQDGRLWGDNTDAYGFLANTQNAAPNWRPDSGPAVVIGAGGAARAVAFAMADAGAPEVRLVNRTPERGEQLAHSLRQSQKIQAEVWPWADRAGSLEGAALLVNTTSLGMFNQPPLDLPLAALPQQSVVADIVYVPLETPLLAAARTRGNIAVDGLGMLLHQAVPGFEAWFGVRPAVSEGQRKFVAQSIG